MFAKLTKNLAKSQTLKSATTAQTPSFQARIEYYHISFAKAQSMSSFIFSQHQSDTFSKKNQSKYPNDE